MSDIFNEYGKIALEKGLIKEADVMDSEDKKKSKEYKDTIMALYGVDPDNKKERNIVDEAHPEPVIIAPAYDRLNTLVENINERQDIIHQIVMKPPNGNLTQHRYASKDLLDTLISLGYKLDNSGEEGLSKLADKCSIQLTKGMEKEASLHKVAFWSLLFNAVRTAGPWVLRGLAGASAWGAIKKHMVGHFDKETTQAIDEAEKALTSFGSKVSGSSKYTVSEIIKYLEVVKEETAKIDEIFSNNTVDVDASDLKNPESLQEKSSLSAAEKKQVSDYVQLINGIVKMIGDRVDISELIGSKGTTLTSMLANMQPKNEGSDSESILESIWDSTLGEVFDPEGDEKTYAINSLYNVRDALAAEAERLEMILKAHGQHVQQSESDIKSELMNMGAKAKEAVVDTVDSASEEVGELIDGVANARFSE